MSDLNACRHFQGIADAFAMQWGGDVTSMDAAA